MSRELQKSEKPEHKSNTNIHSKFSFTLHNEPEGKQRSMSRELQKSEKPVVPLKNQTRNS